MRRPGPNRWLLVALASTAALAPGCWDWDPDRYCVADHWEELTLEDLGVDVALVAIDSFSYPNDDITSHGWVIVGAAGTVIVTGEYGMSWPEDELPGEPFTNVASVGAGTLRGMRRAPDRLWVVGDGGVLATSTDLGESWVPLDIGATGDLHTVLELEDWVIVAGNDELWVRDVDGAWTAPTPPPGGWGQLRSIAFNAFDYVIVGLEGRAWSTSHPPSGDWAAEPVGTSLDLNDIHGFGNDFMAVGAAGTILTREHYGPWTPLDNELGADILAVGYDGLLTADGEIWAFDYGPDGFGGLTYRMSAPGAVDISYFDEHWARAVGDAGSYWRADVVCDRYSDE